MNIDLVFLLMTIMALLINYITLFILFPRRLNNTLTIGIPVLFSVLLHIVLYQTGIETTFYRFWGGFVHIPLYLLLTRGNIFQRLFVVTFIMVCIGFQLALAAAIAGLFTVPESNDFWLLMLILVTVMYTIFASTIFLYSKKMLDKLVFGINWREWLMYIIGAVFTYTSINILISITSGGFRFTLLLFAFWSFLILCFAIIRTNEKAKQRYEFEMAREIISSGREHYQKMNELQQMLQILRHDYKYHLMIVNQMLLSDERDKAAHYLSDLEQQFSKYDLPRFCTNTVLNALMVGYSERCAKIDIDLNITINLPDPLCIPDYDMCIVLGDLLDNVVNVCNKLKNGNVIDLSAGFHGGQLSVVAEYIFDKTISRDERLQIAGENGDELMIKSIRAVTDRYNGEFETLWSEKSYIAYVLMSI